MSQYYFLVASLPSLAYDTIQAPSPEQFLEEVREHASPADYEAVRSASIDAPVEFSGASETVLRWQRFERGLRNALVRVRAARLGSDAAEYIRTDDGGRDETDQTGVSEAAREAVAEESPLTSENMLGRTRWSFLDELEVGHFFDAERLIVYYLKLQLLARRRQFSRDEGERLFRAATEKIMEDYYQEQGDL